MKLRHEAFFNLLLVFCSLAVSILLAELILARFSEKLFVPAFRRENTPEFVYDPVRMYRMRPGISKDGLAVTDKFGNIVVYDTNGASPAPAPPLSKKQKNTFRIIVVGDSFSAGTQAAPDKNYVSIMYSYIKKHTARDIEIINMSAPGYDLEQYYYTLAESADGLQPDLVVVGFFGGNDFRLYRVDTNPTRLLLKRYSGIFRLLCKAKVFAPDTDPAQERSFKALNLDVQEYYRDWMLRKPDFVNKFKRYYGADPEKVTPENAATNFRMTFYMMDESRDVSLITANNARVIDDMRALLPLQTPLIVAYLPPKQQVSEESWNIILKFTRTNAMKLDRFRPQALLAADLKKLGIDFIDLTPVFLQQHDKEKLYLKTGAHWTTRGHNLAGIALAEYIEKRFLND